MCTSYKVVIGNDLAKIKTERAACLPYIVKNGMLFFLFAIDKNSGDITDMGGGVKKDEFALSAGIRELKEESGDVFGSLNSRMNEMSSFVGALGQNGKMSTLFIPMHDEWYAKIDYIEKPSSEIEKMIWINEFELKGLLAVSDKRMWIRVKKFYRPIMTDNFKNLLKKVYVTKKL